MTGDTRTPVTILGLGAMGTALAQAYLDAGHPTTVWNRTAAKAAPLVAAGAHHAENVEDAVAASPLVIACLLSYETTLAALGPAAGAVSGRALVTLNSGTPSGAREMAAWATGHGARFLDGAIKNVPTAVGLPDTVLYYSGDRSVFDEHETTLRVMGGDTSYLGADADLAALYEMAVGGTLLPALLGFFQGAALVTRRGLPATSLVRYTAKWLEMIISVLPVIAEEIDTGDYTRLPSSVGLFHEGIAYDHEIGVEGDVDIAWHLPMHDLLRRAVEAGHRDHSIAALIEVLRKPHETA
ncbi:NAD(P)-dependent oxidoreductase [Streptoalloteichus hindustanus]|uniref:NAD binding domain of 6-phosphogluconate dehydrogenase n=1 Tax=Streptoalloteichus hindustanus TaxID=2017 RepID=A0A1M5I7Z5_STRHI|nr:NAD(P)-binding domain-containing protein [Streptoalloteichus hindustanus]SHG24395.1 NAD binding domain of 6-phosphogluconate dehydrogenase [Streptoalloteichus hindustanus]